MNKFYGPKDRGRATVEKLVKKHKIFIPPNIERKWNQYFEHIKNYNPFQEKGIVITALIYVYGIDTRQVIKMTGLTGDSVRKYRNGVLGPHRQWVADDDVSECQHALNRITKTDIRLLADYIRFLRAKKYNTRRTFKFIAKSYLEYIEKGD